MGFDMPVSMPAFYIMDFSHLAKVEELTGLCGLTTAKNSLVLPSISCDLKLSVFCSYTLSVAIGQRVEFWRKAGKKNSVLGLFCLDCLARPASWNTTPFGVYLLNRRSSLVRSADLDGQVSARSIASF